MKSDFEKLVVAQKYIKVLESDKERLKLEIDKLFQQKLLAEKALEVEKSRREKMTNAEKLKIKTDLYVQQLNSALAVRNNKLRKCEKSRTELLGQLLKLKREGDDQ